MHKSVFHNFISVLTNKFQIHVVDEKRQYAEWTNDISETENNSRYVCPQTGIIAAKKALNDLHFQLGMKGYSQVKYFYCILYCCPYENTVFLLNLAGICGSNR